jgi:hypothetical protein
LTFSLSLSFKFKVGFQIAIFLRRGAEVSNKIEEVIIKNTRFQYQRSLAPRGVESDINRVDQERFKLQIAVKRLAKIVWLYSPE